MPNPLAIDAHAHICTEETMNLLNKETPKVASSLKQIEKDVFEWTVAGVPYRPLPLGGFDIEQRLKDMKASDVDMQVLSNTPQTFLYNQDAGMTAAACIVQNDQIAKHVRDYPRSFYGIATLPMQAPKAAADELERAIGKLNLKGMQIGSNINGKNLDEPEFEPVWAVANQHHAFCMVHPNNVAGIDRMKKYYLNNLIGNPVDTTIAAASPGVRRRDRALPQHPLLHGARRRLYAVSGRPLAARLARPPRAESPSEEAAGRNHPHVLLGHHPAFAAAA